MIEACEIPRDIKLPQLAAVLDRQRMGVEFERMLDRSNRSRVTGCEIEWVKYRPSQDCRIAYRLTVEGDMHPDRVTQIVYARMLPKGAALSRYRRGCEAPLVQPLVGPPIAHLEDLDLVVWSFPNDRKLDNLPRLMDPSYLTDDAIPRLMAMRDERPVVTSWRDELVHYVPERSCMIRVICELERSTGPTQETYYAKAYYDTSGHHTWSAMNALWGMRDRLPAVAVAQPCFYDERRRILWQQGVEGCPLDLTKQTDADRLRFYRSVGEALAGLHQTQIASRSHDQPSDSLSPLRQTAHFVSAVRPTSYIRLLEVLRALIVGLDDTRLKPMVTLHGDLHLKNFLTQSQRLALIDLDRVRPGPPGQDLGSFFASDLFVTLLEGRSLEAAGERMTHCLESYRSRVPWQISMRDMRWHTAYCLIAERVFRCITRLKPGRLDLIDDLIELSEAILRGEKIFNAPKSTHA